MCKTVKLNGPEVTRKSKNEERERTDLSRERERQRERRRERGREREDVCLNGEALKKLNPKKF